MKQPQSDRAVQRAKRAREKFVLYLEELTRQRRARWIRATSQPGYVRCRVGDEVFEFEVLDAQAEHIDPEGEVEGITCSCRLDTWLWLTPLEEGQRVLSLLRKARVHDKTFLRWQSEARFPVLRFLRSKTNEKA